MLLQGAGAPGGRPSGCRPPIDRPGRPAAPQPRPRGSVVAGAEDEAAVRAALRLMDKPALRRPEPKAEPPQPAAQEAAPARRDAGGQGQGRPGGNGYKPGGKKNNQQRRNNNQRGRQQQQQQQGMPRAQQQQQQQHQQQQSSNGASSSSSSLANGKAAAAAAPEAAARLQESSAAEPSASSPPAEAPQAGAAPAVPEAGQAEGLAAKSPPQRPDSDAGALQRPSLRNPPAAPQPPKPQQPRQQQQQQQQQQQPRHRNGAGPAAAARAPEPEAVPEPQQAQEAPKPAPAAEPGPTVAEAGPSGTVAPAEQPGSSAAAAAASQPPVRGPPPRRQASRGSGVTDFSRPRQRVESPPPAAGEPPAAAGEAAAAAPDAPAGERPRRPSVAGPPQRRPEGASRGQRGLDAFKRPGRVERDSRGQAGQRFKGQRGPQEQQQQQQQRAPVDRRDAARAAARDAGSFAGSSVLGSLDSELERLGGAVAGGGEEADTPLLASKPTLQRGPARRPAGRKQQGGGKNTETELTAFKRMASEMRVGEDQLNGGEGGGRRRRPKDAAAASADAIPASERSAPPGKGRQSASRRRQPEKQDIEKQRATRAARREQRKEQAEASALVQEEIFEVGSEGMSVGELADRLAVNGGDVLKTLFLKGIMAQVNQTLDKNMVKVVAEEYGVEVLDLEEAGLDTLAKKTADYADAADQEHLLPRPPVVTVMGHVDHGKTSLLDYVRKTRVAAGEAGGITQAIGAYTVAVKGGEEGQKQITFLDTPGHEAFSAMRARGAKVTDIAIIVVACDDGVRPQTQEAISHAKAAGVPIIVALNKIDKEGANIENAKQEMSAAGLLPEEWGGDTPMVPISAKQGTGIDELLETVLLVAEVEQLTANPRRLARGSVVEAHLDRRMGAVATLLVATGTLRVGDVLHAGASFGKVRSLTSSGGGALDAAGPSIAVQMVGLNSVPTAGDEFAVLESEQEARKVAEAIETSQRLSRLAEQAGGSMVTSMTLATFDDDGDALQYLNLILKADASGSVEAIRAALGALPQDRVALRWLLASAGEITASDVQLAYASEGRIIGFNLEPSEAVQSLAKQYGVFIKPYKVIYELIDDVRNLMEGKISAVDERLPLGSADVKAVFGSGSRKVAGCYVDEGLLRKGALAVVTRGRRTVFEGPIASLRRVKDSVGEVPSGNECGVGVAGFNEWRDGDHIACFEVRAKRLSLEEASQALGAQAGEGAPGVSGSWDEQE